MKIKFVLLTLLSALTLMGCATQGENDIPINTTNEAGRFCIANGGTFQESSNQCTLAGGEKMDADVYFQDHQAEY
ncbi:hypothetical protein ACE1OE_03700 [Vibrio sp. E150_011]